jgi:hypothetical protein
MHTYVRSSQVEDLPLVRFLNTDVSKLDHKSCLVVIIRLGFPNKVHNLESSHLNQSTSLTGGHPVAAIRTQGCLSALWLELLPYN